MEERASNWVHTGEVVLDIGDGVGALIIYTKPDLLGQEIEVSRPDDAHRIHTEVLERRIADRPVFAGVFAALPEGHYHIWTSDPARVREVEIAGGTVAEVDWR